MRKSSKSYRFVSIVIPVYNDAARLIKCLEALSTQTYPHDLFEVIIVDNRSEDDIKSLVSQFDCVKYAFESKPGSYAARNHGLSVARGDIIGFTDSDCVPAPDWIENGAKKLLETNNCGLVAGRINFSFRNPERPTTAELYDSLTFLNQKHYVEIEHYGATANAFTFREVFEKVGLFDADLKSGGDRDWGKRVYTAGYQQVYASNVCITHPARHSVKALKTKVVRVVEGQNATDVSERKLLSAFTDFLKDAKPYLGYARSVLRNGEICSIGYKIGLIRIHIVLRYTRAWKKFQLSFR
ncbi:glycosyltransferase family 2 protein [cf. Phormidesmis sp. LEGE 11477]|uniref:glycosyltransferase n=1 Tax=cf. Phormidesmis sp. LEGE 11477 TaxID=1828680 RepID=UPI00187F4EA4|nr:glycosyltransferase family A protein [cf. Phormidesmis sp. LEGE 11477]MBE9061259.1 glycosyltransferase family 2 protein [cf. Phormidesmis sp. LEGE 11477]